MTVRTILRRARRQHWADCGDFHRIEPGEFYLQGTEFPGGDLGFADMAGHPVRLRECRACAERYGRGHLFPTSSSPVSVTPGDEVPPGEASHDGAAASPGASKNIPSP